MTLPKKKHILELVCTQWWRPSVSGNEKKTEIVPSLLRHCCTERKGVNPEGGALRRWSTNKSSCAARPPSRPRSREGQHGDSHLHWGRYDEFRTPRLCLLMCFLFTLIKVVPQTTIWLQYPSSCTLRCDYIFLIKAWHLAINTYVPRSLIIPSVQSVERGRCTGLQHTLLVIICIVKKSKLLMGKSDGFYPSRRSTSWFFLGVCDNTLFSKCHQPGRCSGEEASSERWSITLWNLLRESNTNCMKNLAACNHLRLLMIETFVNICSEQCLMLRWGDWFNQSAIRWPMAMCQHGMWKLISRC